LIIKILEILIQELQKLQTLNLQIMLILIIMEQQKIMHKGMMEAGEETDREEMEMVVMGEMEEEMVEEMVEGEMVAEEEEIEITRMYIYIIIYSH
jgi:hypothetical protein